MKILKAALAQIHAHLEAGYPNEACGVLLGHAGTVTEAAPATNERTDSAHNRYLITRAQIDIQNDADKRGLEVMGYYHSHPDVPARPSQFDLENSIPWPGISYLIVSVCKGKAVETNSWLTREDRSQFDQEPVEVL